MQGKNILLISFYNQNALGIRYLEQALKISGYNCHIILFKEFNSVSPKEATEKELIIIKEIIDSVNPLLIGLSVMSTLYMDTVIKVNNTIKNHFDNPVVWGGIYPTLFPEESLAHADFIIRGEGEESLIELADAISNDSPYEKILNLGYKEGNVTNNNAETGTGIIINDIRPLCDNLDKFGIPSIGTSNKYLVTDNCIIKGDPQLSSMSYDITASRGCPYACSYCSSVNLKRIYKNKGKSVRFRSVSSVIEELKIAKLKIKRLKKIHFWDEIFPDNEEWVAEFAQRYKKEISLPFQIWCHPLRVNEKSIEMLVQAGLYKTVMGIQSGSENIRRNIFNRYESQENIIEASKILSRCKVPQVIYDFILRHPFESEEDIRKTYELCTQLAGPFQLQLHSLNFLPGTDIAKKALDMNIMSREELDNITKKPMKELYKLHWKSSESNVGGRTGYRFRSDSSRDSNSSLHGKACTEWVSSLNMRRIDFWYSLIYMTQFPITRAIAKYLSRKVDSFFCIRLGLLFQTLLKPVDISRDYIKKGILVLHQILS